MSTVLTRRAPTDTSCLRLHLAPDLAGRSRLAELVGGSVRLTEPADAAVAVLTSTTPDEVSRLRWRDQVRVLVQLGSYDRQAGAATVVSLLQAGADFVMVDAPPAEIAARVRVLTRRSPTLRGWLAGQRARSG
ncbi:MAG: hypothetical protein ACYDB7_10850 [Mycobacteriales bacterium]